MNIFRFFRLLSATALVIAFSPPISANAKGHQHRRHYSKTSSKQSVEKHVEHMTKKLGLNEEQARQIRSILAEKHRKLEVRRLNDSLSRNKRRIQASKIHQQSHQKVHHVLRPDQIQLIKQHRNAKFSKRAAIQLKKLKVVLELTPKQVKAIEAIQANHIQTKIGLYDSNNGDRTVIKKRLREQRNAFHVEIREQLTEEQVTKLNAMKQHRKHKRRYKYGESQNHQNKRKGQGIAKTPV